MTQHRKIAAGAAAIAALLLLLLLVLPMLAAGPIEARVQAMIERNVNADVAWDDAALSLLRGFPHATLRLDAPSVTGRGPFAGDTLVAAGQLRIVLDLGSVLRSVRGRGPLVVRSIDVHQPTARLLVLEDGAASWDIVRAREADDARAGRSLDLRLRALRIRDGRILFENRQAGLVTRLVGVDHTLSGDFTADRFMIDARTQADSTSVAFAGLPYVSGAELELNTRLDADRDARRIVLEDAGLRLNRLVLALRGTIAAAPADQLALDLAFEAPGNSFTDILSLVPAVYAQDFAALQTSGRMAVSGFVRGVYGPASFPAFALHATVDEGRFRYPDLPLPAREIGAALAVTNPGGHADSTVVELQRFHMVIGGDPVDATFTLRTPVSDPDLALQASGTLRLDELARTVKLPDVEQLAGTIAGELALRARHSALDTGAYEQVHANGTITARGVALRTAALPHEVRIDEARLQLTPQHAELVRLRGALGSSDVEASGRLDNLLGFALRNQELRGSASVHSRSFDLNEWRSQREDAEVVPVPAGVDFTLQADLDRLVFGPLEYANARGSVRIKDQRITIDEFRMGMLGGSAVASGWYETVQPERPAFDVELRLADVDIPSAFASLNTVRTLAPVAQYAQGRVTADVRLNGAMGTDMLPLYDALTGLGSFETSQLVLSGFPAFAQLSNALHVDALENPTLEAVASSFEIRDGRLHVQPFEVGVGPVRMHVAGSNGIDRSLAYDLRLEVPRSLFGTAAEPVLASFGDQASRLGIDLAGAQRIALGVQLTGSVTDPKVETRLASVAGSVTGGVEQALRDAADQRADAVGERVDSAALEARRRAEAEAAQLVARAEQRAEAIRAEARTLAEKVRSEGYARADSLEARASNPAARIAARAAAGRMRQEADASADRIIAEADARAQAVVDEAKRSADALLQR